MYVYHEFGEFFLHSTLGKKQSPKKDIIKKLSFFILGNRLQILLKAIEDDNDADIKGGFKQLNAWLKSGKQQSQ